MPKIVLTVSIKSEPNIVFDLARNIYLHVISTKKTNVRAVAGRTSGFIELGESVTWRAKHLGFYQNLTSKITEFNNPNYFVDEMVKGAFTSFRHVHSFKKQGDFTTMTDTFDYVSPLGFLGRCFNTVFLTNYMRNLLGKRISIIKDFAESNKWRTLLEGRYSSVNKEL